MSQTVPATMKAVITQGDQTAKVLDVPVPEIDDDEVLVKVVAIAQNPTDWKHVVNFKHEGTISGCDWSGHVVKVGKNVAQHAVGDRVAGFVHGGTYTDRGAFAEYVKTPAELAWQVPSGLSHEGAATMGCSFWTAVQALFHPTRLGLVEPPNKVEKEEWVLVYGGSGSVGMFAIQLAHAAGYKVVTTASPRNHSLVKSLGADAVFDYNDSSSIGKIKELTNNALSIGVDAISEVSAQKFSVQTFGASGGKLISILGRYDEATALRPDVTVQPTLIYTALGSSFTFAGQPYPASAEDRAHMAHFLKKVPELVSAKQVGPNPTKLIEGGLDGVAAGFQYLREGKASGEKVVHRVSE